MRKDQQDYCTCAIHISCISNLYWTETQHWSNLQKSIVEDGAGSSSDASDLHPTETQMCFSLWQISIIINISSSCHRAVCCCHVLALRSWGFCLQQTIYTPSNGSGNPVKSEADRQSVKGVIIIWCILYLKMKENEKYLLVSIIFKCHLSPQMIFYSFYSIVLVFTDETICEYGYLYTVHTWSELLSVCVRECQF